MPVKQFDDFSIFIVTDFYVIHCNLDIGDDLQGFGFGGYVDGYSEFVLDR